MNQIEQIDNPEVLGLTLRTVVNKKYDGPGADDPSRLQSKCIRVLLLPRILDVLCFWMAAGFFAWNYENRDYRYFAIRILNPDSTTDFLPAFIGWKTILATVAFAVIVALTFLLRVSYLKAKRAKTKEPYPATKQMFPDAKISKGQVFFSTVFLMILLVGAHFVVSLILKKNWREMPVSVDLGITAGIFALANLHACLKVEQSVVRCYTCHVISSLR